MYEVAPTIVIWCVAVVGLAFGVVGCVLGAMSQRRHRTLQVQLRQMIEESRNKERARNAQRATLRAFVEQKVDVTWCLNIRNEGHGEASNLTASINGYPLEKCPLVDNQAFDTSNSNSLEGHHELRIPLKTVDRPKELQLELTWSDGSGDLGFYEASLITADRDKNG